MKRNRTSGVLAHPTSFPSPYGIGDLGAGAYAFADFLERGRQSYWQVLPLNPTSYGDSPYQGFSTFAGNPLLISPDKLAADGLLSRAEADEAIGTLTDEEREGHLADYGQIIARKDALFRKAYAAFAAIKRKPAYTEFCKENKAWLEDYCLFVALKAKFIAERKAGKDDKAVAADYKAFADMCGNKQTEAQVDDNFFGAAWISWPTDARDRQKPALKSYAEELADEIAYQKFLQYIFFAQWQELKAYCNARGIQIIGDVPIFVALDSADVWKDKALFELDGHGFPIEVAGCPPDFFTETGQLWGNPLYDWEKHAAQKYAWWAGRVAETLKTVDLIRIDHFRGFEAFWATPFGDATAKGGKWRKGPGADLFAALKSALGNLPLIAEDLGEITEKVYKLRDKFNLPGMRVIQFAFGEDGNDAVAMPHNFETAHCVAYTGTHDNDTALGWYHATSEQARDHYRRYMNVSGDDPAGDLVRLTFLSCADWAVVPVQDVMRLDNSARMNCPGTATGNWRFRYTQEMLRPEQADWLAYLSKLTDRNRARFEAIAEREKAETNGQRADQ